MSSPFEFEASIGTISADMAVSVDGQAVAGMPMVVVGRTFVDFDAAMSAPLHFRIDQNTEVRLDVTIVPGAACARAGGSSWTSEAVSIGIDTPPNTTICHRCDDSDGSHAITCN